MADDCKHGAAQANFRGVLAPTGYMYCPDCKRLVPVQVILEALVKELELLRHPVITVQGTDLVKDLKARIEEQRRVPRPKQK